MKKAFISLIVIAAAAIASVSCNKIEPVVPDNQEGGIPFEFYAKAINSKTTNSGISTLWAAGDQVNLFHADAGSISYISDGAFTTATAGSSVTFTGELSSALTNGSGYDWYAIYPYNKNIATPANTGTKGYVTFGSSKDGHQTQTGNDNMSHIAGANYPVAGSAKNVTAPTTPSITMNHLTTVMAVKVTNSTTSPITVSEISFTGTERISGTFFVDFVSSPVIYTSSGDGYTSDSEVLQVTSGSEIPAGSNATFYLAVKPFTAPATSTISVSVTADNGTQVFNKVLGSATTFAAGKINTLNVSYNKEVVLNLPFEDDMSWADSGTESDGAAITASDFPTLGGETMYSSVNSGYKGPGAIKLGTSSLRGDITTVDLDLSSAYTIIVSAKTWGSDDSTLQVFVDGTQVGSDATLYNEFVEYVYKPGAATASSKVKVKVDGKRGYINSIRIISGTLYTAKPVIHLTSTPAALSAAAGNASIEYTILNPTGASVSASAAESWINTFDCSVANTVKFNYTANTGDTRSQNVTLSYTGADDKVVNITQNSSAAPTEVTISIASYATEQGWVNETKYSSVTIDSNITISGNTSGNNGKYYTSNNSWRHYEGDSQTLTLTATGGKTLQSVTFTYAYGNNGRVVYNDTQYTSGTSISLSGTTANFSVGHSSGTKNGNIQITSITVIYK